MSDGRAARRVLFVHHRPQASGAARSLALLIGALDDEWEPHVLVPAGAAAELFATAGAIVHRGPVPAFTHTWDVQYHGLRWLVAAREAASIPTHVHQLQRVLDEQRPAIVHLNDAVMLTSGIVAARRGYNVVWHLRSSLPDDRNDIRSRFVARTISRHAAATIAIDEDVAASYRVTPEPRIIPNPVAVTSGSALSLDVPAGRLRVGWVGYLRRQKGWPEFLDALGVLVGRGIPAHGVVAGGAIRPSTAFRGWRGLAMRAARIPDEEGAFWQHVRASGLGDRVTTVDFTLDVGPVYRALDIVVFPNQGRGLGRPVLEALCYGVPVVAAGSAGGAGVVSRADDAVLLQHPDAAKIADAIEALASGERSPAASESAVRRFAPDAHAASVEAVWRSLARSNMKFTGREGASDEGSETAEGLVDLE